MKYSIISLQTYFFQFRYFFSICCNVNDIWKICLNATDNLEVILDKFSSEIYLPDHWWSSDLRYLYKFVASCLPFPGVLCDKVDIWLNEVCTQMPARLLHIIRFIGNWPKNWERGNFIISPCQSNFQIPFSFNLLLCICCILSIHYLYVNGSHLNGKCTH